ncbi:MAG: carbon storage regulator CsrA [Clostridiales bacterium]|jgi:carbon storage regulator|nr:carbon storage regulator CsrA [Clostridiales bacterium]MDR2751185.1 carbon storage regulator CsrA [Clostridiales bacterium]
MLALSRKVGESIIISDNIEITVLGVSGETAKLGVTAPRSIPVHRKEVYEQIQLENKEASSNLNVDGFKTYSKNKPEKK